MTFQGFQLDLENMIPSKGSNMLIPGYKLEDNNVTKTSLKNSGNSKVHLQATNPNLGCELPIENNVWTRSGELNE